MKDVREAFEEWLREHRETYPTPEHDNGVYIHYQTQNLWEMWKARQPEIDELRKENEALKAALVKCRDNVLEQAAKECELVMNVPTWSDNAWQDIHACACGDCAEAIRAMNEEA